MLQSPMKAFIVRRTRIKLQFTLKTMPSGSVSTMATVELNVLNSSKRNFMSTFSTQTGEEMFRLLSERPS